jgi:hypothetical protein
LVNCDLFILFNNTPKIGPLNWMEWKLVLLNVLFFNKLSILFIEQNYQNQKDICSQEKDILGQILIQYAEPLFVLIQYNWFFTELVLQ